MACTYQNAFLPSVMTTLVGVGGDLEGAEMILFTNAEEPGPTALLADLDQPTFTGYAASSAVTYGTVHLDDTGRTVVHANPKEFKVTANGAENVVTGVGLVDAAGTTLLATYMLAEPINFQTTEDVYLIGFPLILSQPSGETPQILP